MAKLTAKARKKIKGSNFALPGRRYPIDSNCKQCFGHSTLCGPGGPSAGVPSEGGPDGVPMVIPLAADEDARVSEDEGRFAAQDVRGIADR